MLGFIDIPIVIEGIVGILNVIQLYIFKIWFDHRCYIKEDKKRNIINRNFNFFVLIFIIITCLQVPDILKMIIAIYYITHFFKNNYETKEGSLYTTFLKILVLFVFVDIFSMGYISWINGFTIEKILIAPSRYKVYAVLLSKIAFLFIAFIYKVIIIDLQLKKKDVLYYLVPIITNMWSMIIVLGYWYKFTKVGFFTSYIMASMLLLFISSNLCVVLVIRRISKHNKKVLQEKFIAEKIKIQGEYYENIRKNQDRVRELYHDMNNHLILLRKVDKEDNLYSKYVNDLKLELDSYEETIETGNTVLDIIMYEKSKICREKNINLEIDIDFSSCHFISLIDINSIFANILDNAIEACEKLETEERFIRLSGRVFGQIFVVRAENTKEKKEPKKSDRIVTSKSDRFIHGLGLKNVNKSVKKYGGTVNIDCGYDKFTIKITIPLV